MKTPGTFKDFILRVHPDPDSITHVHTGRRTQEYLESEQVYKLAEQYVKSMQEDHEKELIEFHLFICKLYNKPDDSLCTYLNTASEEAITQFRNKQQDR